MAEKKKKKKKKEEWSPQAFPAPQERNLGKEMGELAPILGDLARTQSELDIEAKQKIAEDQWNFMTRHYGEMQGYVKSDAQLARELQELERQGSRAFLRDTGPAMWEEAKRTQPELGQAMGRISAEMADTSRTPRSPFAAELDRMAMEELRLGGQLTPEAERMAQQTARQAYSARGQVMGNAASLAEVMNRDEMSRQRLRERQGIAAGRESVWTQQQQLWEGEQATDRQFALSSAALIDQLNPAYKVLGLQTTTNIPALGTTGSLAQFQQGNVNSVGGIMQSGLGYGQDVYSSNQNMQTDLFVNYQNAIANIEAQKIASKSQITAAQLQAGATTSAARTAAGGQMTGALIGAGGAVGGAALSAAAPAIAAGLVAF